MTETGRRDFLKTSLTASATVLLPSAASASPPNATDRAAPSVQSYRRLGRTELEISDISMGTSRLREGQENLVHHALDRGINYFDSAESYTRGQSENVLGRALKGERQNVYLVSKHIASAQESASSMMRVLEESLRRLNTDYIDVYMNHAINSVARMENPEWAQFIAQAKAQGKIRFSGASGHAGNLIECLDYVIDEDLADVLLVAYNFGQDPAFYEKITRSFDMIATQTDLPRVLAKAKEKDVGIVAMKTLMGARLNDMRPWEEGGATFSQAAFRWVLSNPQVDALVISMTGESQIDEFLGASGASALAHGDQALLERYAALNGATYCRQVCNECSDSCPYGVQIADVLRTRMYATDYEDVQFARDEYALLAVDGSACLSCSGEPCQNACPHGIAIDQLCAPTHRMLA